MTTRLPLLGASLVLDTAGDWCAVWLEEGGERRHLGSDTTDVIRRRLVAHLAGPRPAAGEVDGLPVQWVMSLAEPHCTLYAQFGTDGRRLLVQGPDSAWLWQGELPEPMWQAWRGALAPDAATGNASEA